MEFITEDIAVEFQLVTGYDILKFFEDYQFFGSQYYNSIVNYYSGNTNVSNQAAFTELDRLYNETTKIIEIFDLNAKNFLTYDAWILLDNVENARENLLTIQNLPKYLRSTIDQSTYNTKLKLQQSAAQGDTLESIQRNITGSDDPDQWVDTALKNNLAEEDYSPEGGYIINVELNNQFDFALNSVVKGIASIDDTYGLDIYRKLTIEDNDLLVLSPSDTVEQAAYILVNLQKRQNPIFPDHGYDKNLVVGRSLLTVSYPIFFRQLADTVATDDTFKSIGIKDIRREADAVYMDVELVTQAGDFSVTQTITLTA